MTTTNILHPTQRPDFVFVHAENSLIIVEIKPPKHAFNDEDWKRLNNYYDAVEEFFKAKGEFKELFPAGFKIILVADEVKIADSTNRKAFQLLEEKKALVKRDWEALLHDTKMAHQDFLKAREEFEASVKE